MSPPLLLDVVVMGGGGPDAVVVVVPIAVAPVVDLVDDMLPLRLEAALLAVAAAVSCTSSSRPSSSLSTLAPCCIHLPSCPPPASFSAAVPSSTSPPSPPPPSSSGIESIKSTNFSFPLSITFFAPSNSVANVPIPAPTSSIPPGVGRGVSTAPTATNAVPVTATPALRAPFSIVDIASSYSDDVVVVLLLLLVVVVVWVVRGRPSLNLRQTMVSG
mmetsp:Transcript_21168/g.46171  ORF Transcript_21168/g.46171 Transcript_21168/m.46171 type:complete len:216 (-) Transcript_21168:788-1435(-)